MEAAVAILSKDVRRMTPTSPASAAVAPRKRAAVVAVTSGKGGVGKTNISANLSVALGRLGRRVMLFDADLGLSNANIVLGLPTDVSIGDVVDGGATVRDVVVPGPGGIGVVPGGSGLAELASLTPERRARLVTAFAPYATDLDYLVVDTAAGISADVTALVGAADYAVIVLCEEPTAFMDAYALLKTLCAAPTRPHFLVVTNMVDTEIGGRRLFHRFREVAERFVGAELTHLGSIPTDPHVRAAILRKRCVLDAYPASLAARAIGRLAGTLDEQVGTSALAGQGFFGEAARAGCN